MEEKCFLVEETWGEEKRALEARTAFLRRCRKHKHALGTIPAMRRPPVKATPQDGGAQVDVDHGHTMLSTPQGFWDQDSLVLPCRADSP